MATAGTNNANNEKSSETFGSCKMPHMDFNAIADSYKKNMEILGLINKMSLEVLNGITKLQSAYVKQLMTDLGSVFEKGTKPSEAVARFSEVTRDNIVKAIGNSKQISDMIIANNNEISAAVTKRFKESLEEAKHIVNNKS